MREYWDRIVGEYDRLVEVARAARSRGLDPEEEPEITPARNTAERVEGLIKIEGLADRVKSALDAYGKEVAAFRIAEEIALGKLGGLSGEEAADKALRVALAILTEGITVAPIQGIEKVKIKSAGGRRYLAVYYAGPIRSAGGTEQALTVLIADWIRELMGIPRFKASLSEARRVVEEIRLYERNVSRFQYHVSDEVLERVVMNLPIQVTGIATNDIEVNLYRDVPTIETNKLRGGAIRVINDGIVGKAPKLRRYVEKLGLKGWEWLKDVEASKRKGGSALFDIIAGRPIFAYPDRPGGFRVRYGRAVNTGFAATGVHPATMAILDGFIAVGTQIRVDGPGKSSVVLPVDTIDPPIVKLKNGDVVEVESLEHAKKISRQVDEILYLGDMLIAYGEFLENNKRLVKPGINEEWWTHILETKLRQVKPRSIDPGRLREILGGSVPTEDEALSLSLELHIPLHPRYTFLWERITVEDYIYLRGALRGARLGEGGLVIDYEKAVKEILERLAAPHTVAGGKLRVKYGLTLLKLLGLGRPPRKLVVKDSIIKTIHLTSGIPVIPKAPSYIKARMGRPEKAKMREMKPPVHVLFPVGEGGGPQRDLGKAREVDVELNLRVCPKCGHVTYKYVCPRCGARTRQGYVCPKCGEISTERFCRKCRVEKRGFYRFHVDVGGELQEAFRRVGLKKPVKVKGVRGLINALKSYEILEKGVLRAANGLSVYRDGTVRIDMINAPLTHFRPRDIGVSAKRLRELGYREDIHGRPLESDDQVVELYPQDIVVPESVADALIAITRFVDDELEKIYGMERYYRVKSRDQLVGHLVIGLSPHTSAGVVGRIIGFTKARVCYAHPFWHAAKRRNCDGDEDSIILALDALINFSLKYLPEKIGGLMDAPLVVTVIVDPREVDDEVHNMDSDKIPPWFYGYAWAGVEAKLIEDKMPIVKNRLSGPQRFRGYGFHTYPGSIDGGVLKTTYVSLRTVKEKVERQIRLMKKLRRQVDLSDALEKLLVKHFIPDIMGNLRSYFKQKFKCPKCGGTYRRITLTGKCPRCGAPLRPTLHKRSVVKYLDEAQRVVDIGGLSNYHRQRLMILKKNLEEMLGVDLTGMTRYLGDEA